MNVANEFDQFINDLVVSHGFSAEIKNDINLKNSMSYTPLHYAVTWNMPNIVKNLIRKNADVNVQAWDGLTPTHEALLFEHVDILILLLGEKPDLSIKDEDGASILSLLLESPYRNLL